MKLLRHGPAGAEKPGLVAPDGSLRDLSGHVPDIAGAVLSEAGLAALRPPGEVVVGSGDADPDTDERHHHHGHGTGIPDDEGRGTQEPADRGPESTPQHLFGSEAVDIGCHAGTLLPPPHRFGTAHDPLDEGAEVLDHRGGDRSQGPLGLSLGVEQSRRFGGVAQVRDHPAGEPGPTAKSRDCEQQAQAWLAKLGLPQEPRVLTLQRSGWRFPVPTPYAYAVFDVLPRAGSQPADNAGL